MTDTSKATETASQAVSTTIVSPTSKNNAIAFSAVKDTETYNWTFLGYGISIGNNYSNYRRALIAHMSMLMANDKEVSTISDAKRSTSSTATSTVSGANARNKVRSSSNAGSKTDNDAEALIEAEEAGASIDDINGQGKTKDNPGVYGSKYAMYNSPSVSDASVGGNDAINPYCAFCKDDDIIHDVSVSNDGSDSWGMGRCYGEMYESKQVILYLTMGLPKFRNLQTWLENATDKELAEMNDKGTVSLTTKIGKLITGGVKLAIELPWLPLIWAANAISSIRDYKVTEYFYFRDNMPMYYRYVNSILSEIAVGMGLYENSSGGSSSSTTNGTNNNSNSNMSTTQQAKYEANMPLIMQDGPDIFKIMCRRAKRLGGTSQYNTADDLFVAMQDKYEQANKNDKDKSIWDKLQTGLRNFWTGIETGALEGMNFIGFRIERSDNSNESFSNSTADSPLLSTLNNEVAQNRERSMGALTGGEGAVSNLTRLYQQGANMVKNVSDIISGKKGAEGTIAYMASGNGFFDLPKQWSGSSGISRSLSFNLKLRAKTGGDNVSIFQSIMIPLACLLAAALPRGVGDSTYTSPFIVRAFCKGMFAIPAGIISSLSITRGAGEFGWSLSRLPTVVDVSFTIEDLSPMIFLSIAGQGELTAVMQALTNNTKMHEYIDTLVGLGVKERYYLMGQMKRRLRTAMLISKNTVFSATYRGYVMGDSNIIRSLMAITPWTRVPRN